MNKTNGKKSVDPVPKGYHTVTPYLLAENAADLIEFMEQAFDARLTFKMPDKNGLIVHATVTIGDSTIMLSDSMKGHPPQTAMLYVYLENADEVFKNAVQAGATPVREIRDEFYGDRAGAVKDKWGNTWWIATHTEDLDQKELEERATEAMKDEHEIEV